ncbi:CpaF family protein [Candidatus Micrarchaeota archaeon]|nr:CpaF family protein [Candidatus Micrarchaeota archaeon]
MSDSYSIEADGVPARVVISNKEGEYVPIYSLEIPFLGEATENYLNVLKQTLLKNLVFNNQEILDPRNLKELKKKFSDEGKSLVNSKFPSLSDREKTIIAGRLLQEMFGLDKIEFLLKDDWIEEICINSSTEPIWVFHRKHGWVKTNINLPSDSVVSNYAGLIGRRVGRQINIQNPLLDAYLITGDRVNATLFPISMFGNTITIRKFARKPWTITDLIKNNTISSELAALLWLAMQYEMNVLVSGGTGSGKTSFLNVLTAFIPQNQRVISIEQTREITLPKHLQWVPLVVRETGAEEHGKVEMLDLMVNSLRMRPDRIIVGEVRRAEEAQVLFEAMHTGHSVYATLHAETVSETLRRLNNPPIDLPGVMLESLHLVVAMYRDKRSGIRRVFEVGELIPSEKGEHVSASILYKWKAFKDSFEPDQPSIRLMESLMTFTRMNEEQVADDLKEKQKILDWLVKQDVNTVDGVGEVFALYYSDKEELLKRVRKK